MLLDSFCIGRVTEHALQQSVSKTIFVTNLLIGNCQFYQFQAMRLL
jgi:hypothetical protein